MEFGVHHGASILLAPVGSPQVQEFIVQLQKFRDEVTISAQDI
jgi:hypothetical protein